jgi:hypothetical protein
MPPVLRIGHLDYTIDWAQEAHLAKMNAHATCDTNDNDIRIGDHLSGPHLVEVAIHEILHAVRHVWCREIPDDKAEEAEVRWQAKALTQVFRDNVPLFDWLRHELDEHEANRNE